ncbi:MAG: glycosyltransferase family 2 protein [Pseudomonadota bacterium]
MSDSRLISVIIPTHNRFALLERAVRSVLVQTHSTLEILIADDASSDETPELVSKLKAQDTRVKGLRVEANIGAAAIRNRALDIAKGRYICFLDDDDEWYPEKLERQLPFADAYSIVGCLSRRVDGYAVAGMVDVDTSSRKKWPQSAKPSLKEISLNDVFFNNGRLSPSNVMVRRDLLVGVGGFDESLVASQGRDLFVRLVHQYGAACLIEEQLCKHYQRHSLPRISTSRNHLIGGWAEFRKNAPLMSKRLRHWRLFLMSMRESKFSDKYSQKLSWILKALLHVRLWRLKEHAKVFASQTILK